MEETPEQKMEQSGGNLPEENLLPEQKPETTPPAAAVVKEAGQALEQVKKLELQGMSDALQILTQTTTELKELSLGLAAALVEVGNMKAELAAALTEAEAMKAQAQAVAAVVQAKVTETVQQKKKMKLF